MVKRFIGANSLVAEYQEIESGRKSGRVKLAEAIAKAKETGATLVIAKLDRLSRDASFIMTLKNSGVDFVCADMPEANSLTIGLMAVIAENEVRMLSDRTKAGLQQIKNKLDRGETHISKTGQVVTSLGNAANLSRNAIAKGRDNHSKNAYENPDNKKAGAFIIALSEAGMNFVKITEKLNNAGFKTPRGFDFNPAQTKRLYERYK